MRAAVYAALGLMIAGPAYAGDYAASVVDRSAGIARFDQLQKLSSISKLSNMFTPEAPRKQPAAADTAKVDYSWKFVPKTDAVPKLRELTTEEAYDLEGSLFEMEQTGVAPLAPLKEASVPYPDDGQTAAVGPPMQLSSAPPPAPKLTSAQEAWNMPVIHLEYRVVTQAEKDRDLAQRSVYRGLDMAKVRQAVLAARARAEKLYPVQ